MVKLAWGTCRPNHHNPASVIFTTTFSVGAILKTFSNTATIPGPICNQQKGAFPLFSDGEKPTPGHAKESPSPPSFPSDITAEIPVLVSLTNPSYKALTMWLLLWRSSEREKTLFPRSSPFYSLTRRLLIVLINLLTFYNGWSSCHSFSHVIGWFLPFPLVPVAFIPLLLHQGASQWSLASNLANNHQSPRLSTPAGRN